MGTEWRGKKYIYTKSLALRSNADLLPIGVNSWVQTDMGNAGAVAFGLQKAEIAVEESLSGLVKVVRHAFPPFPRTLESPNAKESQRSLCIYLPRAALADLPTSHPV